MANKILLSAGFVILGLTGCSGSEEETTASAAADNAAMEGIMDCPATAPREASAVIDKMPGPDAPALRVTFTFDTPNEGDEYALEFSHSEESAPPAYVYNLVRTVPGHSRVWTPVEDFSYTETSFSEPELRAVIIQCDGFQEPFEISPVEIVQ